LSRVARGAELQAGEQARSPAASSLLQGGR
jgi:hypothetical protein